MAQAAVVFATKCSETGENVHDEDRDQVHLDLRRKCEILSCSMAMFGGDAADLDGCYLCMIVVNYWCNLALPSGGNYFV